MSANKDADLKNSKNIKETETRPAEAIKIFILETDSIIESVSNKELGDLSIDAKIFIFSRLESLFNETIEVLSRDNQNNFKSECNEIRKWKREKNKWYKNYSSLFHKIHPLIRKIENQVSLLVENDEFYRLPEEATERLNFLKESLGIISRMFGRLNNHRQTKKKLLGQKTGRLDNGKKYITVQIPAIDPSKNLQKEINSAISFYRSHINNIHNLFTNIRDKNYQTIREERIRVENLERTIYDFIKNHLLPAIDGLERGIWDEEELKKPLTRYPEATDMVQKWFDIYSLCFEFARKSLLRENLRLLEVKQGDSFNPKIHMALGTESCEFLQNEQILEIVRSGYKYGGKTIRCAEVIVVRNKPKGG